MTIGMTGDLLRGAKPIGMADILPLGPEALYRAIEANPEVSEFVVYVNRFGQFMAEQMVSNARASVTFIVKADEKYAKDSWRIEPVGGE